MIKFFSFLLFTNLAFAGLDGQRDQCFKRAWMATDPSEAQSSSAQQNFEPIKKLFEDNKEKIHAAMHGLHTAMKAHPISKADVKAAKANLKNTLDPLTDAAEDAAIDTINLLSAEQRSVFDRVLMRCKHNKDSGRRPPGRRHDPGRDAPGRDAPGRDQPGRDLPGRDLPGRDQPGREHPHHPGDDDLSFL